MLRAMRTHIKAMKPYKSGDFIQHSFLAIQHCCKSPNACMRNGNVMASRKIERGETIRVDFRALEVDKLCLHCHGIPHRTKHCMHRRLLCGSK